MYESSGIIQEEYEGMLPLSPMQTMPPSEEEKSHGGFLPQSPGILPV